MVASEPPFAGRKALLLGGDTPIVAAVSHALTEAGAQVIVAGDAANAHRPHDVFDVQSWDRLLASVEGIDLVVAAPPAATAGALNDLTDAQFKAAEANGIIAPWMILKYTIPMLAARARAAIAVIASDDGMEPSAGRIADCATFGALHAMFKSAAIECGQVAPNVRINAVIADEKAVDPADIAAAVLQITAFESDFMTGAELILSAP